MLIITAVTLILVIYPSGAQVIADIIDNGLRMLENVFNLSKWCNILNDIHSNNV